MTEAKEVLEQAWNNREGPAVLATVNGDHTPNVIYVGEIKYEPDVGFVVADNYFDKTRRNIKNGSTRGAVLFITKEGKAYQVKGSLGYHTDGPFFNDMQSWHNPKHPGVAAAVLHMEEVYNGSEKLM